MILPGMPANVTMELGRFTQTDTVDIMSLLGALSLIGLLIKNAIVLIDEIAQQIAGARTATRPSWTPPSAACGR